MTGITNELMLEGWGGRVKDQVFSVKRKREIEGLYIWTNMNH